MSINDWVSKGGNYNFSGSFKPTAEVMEKMVKSKTVETMKVIDLKYFIRSIGGPISNMRKDELVRDVYAYFGTKTESNRNLVLSNEASNR